MVRSSEVDDRSLMGQFILTGSAVPVDSDEIEHTGTGRIGRLMMRPMSLWESGESNGAISLGSLFDEPKEIFAENKNGTVWGFFIYFCIQSRRSLLVEIVSCK